MSTSQRVGVVQTGSANLASVLAGLKRADAAPVLVSSPEEVASYEKIVLPGVGAFGAAIDALQRAEVLEALRDRLRAGAPTLGICLGLQLLCHSSEESPGVEGLGLLSAEVQRFPSELRVPQFGWSLVCPSREGGFFARGYAYFANSYRLLPSKALEGWELALSEYGSPYVAALCKGAVVACQFHPELSGAWGHQLLRRWLALKAEA